MYLAECGSNSTLLIIIYRLIGPLVVQAMLALLTVTLQLYHILNIFKALDVLCSPGGHTASLSHLVLIG